MVPPPAAFSVRAEGARDRAAVRAVNEAAFAGTAEANLVDALRAAGLMRISLVAEQAGIVVGHIAFSPVTLAGHVGLRISGLAPMAVLPAAQRCGIGTALVRAGLAACTAEGFDAVVVVGHAEYYPRFGFAPGSRYSLRCEFDVPDDVFMVCELVPGSLRGAAGVVRYAEAFASF